MSYFHLIYRSKALINKDNSLTEILKVSREFNSTNDITGMLIFRDNHFLQLLEGQEDIVRKLLEKIRLDMRHMQVTVIAETTSEKRMMQDWSMALVDSSSLTNTAKDLFELFDLGRGSNTFESKAALEIIMRKFSDRAKKLVCDEFQ